MGYKLMLTELDVNDVQLRGNDAERDAAVDRHVAEYLDIVFSVARPRVDFNMGPHRPLHVAGPILQARRRAAPASAPARQEFQPQTRVVDAGQVSFRIAVRSLARLVLQSSPVGETFADGWPIREKPDE